MAAAFDDPSQILAQRRMIAEWNWHSGAKRHFTIRAAVFEQFGALFPHFEKLIRCARQLFEAARVDLKPQGRFHARRDLIDVGRLHANVMLKALGDPLVLILEYDNPDLWAIDHGREYVPKPGASPACGHGGPSPGVNTGQRARPLPPGPARWRQAHFAGGAGRDLNAAAPVATRWRTFSTGAIIASTWTPVQA
jgi:hypothetical protein